MKTFIKHRRLTIAGLTLALLAATLAINSQTLGAIILGGTPQGNSTGLVGHWTMDGNHISGTTVADQSGQGNDGTLLNGPVPVLGKVGQAMSFNGTDDAVSIPNDASLILTDSFTVSSWIKPETVSSWRMIYDSGSGDEWAIGLWDSTGEIYFARANGDNFMSGVYVTNDELWHHVTVKKDGNTGNNLHFYLDGVLKSSVVLDWITTPSGTPSIGRTDSGTYFQGSIDDVRIYNRALTETEIYKLYSQGAAKMGGSQTDNLQKGLVGHWGLDDGTGSGTAADLTPNGNDGTLTNMDTANDWVSGQVGSEALDFDGTDDYADLNTAPSFSGAFTFALWVKTSTDYTGTYATLIGSTTASYDNLYELVIGNAGYPGMVDNGVFAFHQSGGSWAYANSTQSNLNDGEWHLVIGGRNDSDQSFISVDGGPIVTGTTRAGTINPTLDLYVGARNNNGTPDTNFTGQIDDVRIYNRALSAEEIKELYNLRATKDSSSGPIAHWTFDGSDLSGTTAIDSGSGGNHGTLTNGPVAVKGKRGQALAFDGTDDYIDLSSSPIATHVFDDFTISGWYKSNQTTPTDDQYMFVYGQPAASANVIVFAVGDDPGYVGNLRFLIDDTNCSSPDFYGTSNVMDQTWHLLTAVLDGNQVKIFVDGIKETEATTTCTGTIDANVDVAYIGDDPGETEQVNGQLDDLRIYDRALTDAEVHDLFKAGGGTLGGFMGDILQKGLIGHWGLDDGTGSSTAADLTANGNNGTLNNMDTATDWVNGQVGSGALDIDGSDDYVEVPYNLRYDFHESGQDTPYTLSAWVYMRDITKTQGIVAKWQASTTDGWVMYTDASELYIENYGTSAHIGRKMSISTSEYQDQWLHLVATYNGSEAATGFKLYRNGVRVDTTSINTGSYTGLNIDTKTLEIGAYNNGNNILNGIIDDVRIYNRELSAEKIKELYNLRTTESSSTGPVGHWTFDGPDVSGTTAKDTGGGGNDATLISAPVPVRGKYGQALQFDGTADYIDVADNSAINFGVGDFSLATWFKTSETGTIKALIMKGAGGTGGKRYYLLINNDNQLFAEIDDDSVKTDIDGATTVTDDEWHHAALTVDRDGNAQLYLDGQADGPAVSATSTSTSIDDATKPLRFGRESDGGTRYMNGAMDDVRLYNHALTATEVAALYKTGR